MTEKQASSEIAQSRARFEKWWAESRKLNPDCGCEQRGQRWFKCSYHEGADDAWEWAERDTRERVAQITLPLLDRLAEWCNKQSGWREAREFESEIRQVAERIRGKE